MREHLRRDCSEIWIIDCSPEGHQPDVPTRIFEGVQQTVSIMLAARRPGKDRGTPGRVRFTALPKGSRQQKFDALAALRLDGGAWTEAPIDWRSPFLPRHDEEWSGFLPLPELFDWSSPGVKTHRTWVIAPDNQTLHRRWEMLQNASSVKEKNDLFRSDRDRTLDKIVKVDLGEYLTRPISVGNDRGPIVTPVRYAYRSFDRQWIPPDHRLMSRGRFNLWDRHSPHQVFMTALDAHSPTSGPALTFAAHIPDNHHYKGSFAGMAYPLWHDREATQPNIRPELLARLSIFYGREVMAEEVMAYLAAVMAHPVFTAQFRSDLVRPGLRVPLTAEANLFTEAVALGRDVVWLHCYGERFADLAAGRPQAPPRMPAGERPTIPADGAIPGAPEPLPETMRYDPATRRLHVGGGYVENVGQAVWDYEVSGKQILPHWFGYRRRDRSKPLIGDKRPPSDLEKIVPDHWPAEYTSDLIDLLNVLGRLVILEPRQASLLERILAVGLIHSDDLREAGALRARVGAATA